jgi:hypothetical protein
MQPVANPYAPPAADLATAALAPPYFATSTAKLLLLSAATFGIYPAWWSYQNWRAIRAQTGEKLSPIPRAFFSGFTNFSLFPRLQTIGAKAGCVTRLPHEILALSNLLLSVVIQIVPDENPLGLLLVCAMGIPYLPSNVLARRINLALAPDARPTAPWTALNWIGGILGAAVLALGLIGTLVPGDLE